MTTPTQPSQEMSPAQLAALLALVQAQAAVRQQLAQAAAAAATAAVAGFTAWWDADETTAMIAKVLRVVQPLQRQAAMVTDGYLTRTATIISGRSQRAAGAVDVQRLRRAMTEQVADDILAGNRQVLRVDLGQLAEHPHTAVEPAMPWGLEEARVAQDPAEAYGRVADGYRWSTTMLGDDPEKAQQKAAVRIATTANTDVQLAVRAQYQKTMSAQGATGWRRILHPELSKSGPCGLCVVAADRVYKSEDLLPIHNRCVPAGTRVAADNVLAVTRRDYSGPLVVLFTASGQELTITPNHPVLTDQGWVPAHLIDERHHVLRHRVGQGVVGRGPAKGDGPPLVEDVWRAATVDPAVDLRAVPLSPEDFHGDGADGEVQVVSADCYLPRIGDVSFGHPFRERLLMAGHRGRVGGSCSGSLLKPDPRLRDAPGGGVRGGRDGGALFSRSAGVVDLNGFGLAADLDPGFSQSEVYHAALDAVFLGQGEHRGASQVLLDDLGVREVFADPPRFDPAGFEFAGDGRHAYAQLGRDLRDRLTSDVELDRVVDKRWIQGTSHVYNLYTAEGWYSASNLIVSNCVCEVLPVYNNVDPGITLNGDDLSALYAAAGGNTREKLRRISVVMTEHGELGPVLVHGDQHYRSPEDVARAYASSRRVREQSILEALEQRYEITQLRVARGDPLEKTLRSQQARIEELRRSVGASA